MEQTSVELLFGGQGEAPPSWVDAGYAFGFGTALGVLAALAVAAAGVILGVIVAGNWTAVTAFAATL